jgi:hypothetical protein
MPDFFITDADRKRIATKWLQITLWLLHIWASTCLVALCFIKDANSITAFVSIFSTCTFGIGGTLFILIVNKSVDWFMNKFGNNSLPMDVTKEIKTTETTKVTTPELKDLNVNAETVNVSSSN